MKKKFEDTRRSCPACFRRKEIPAPLPVCQTCVRLVPNKLQAELASAFFNGTAKDQIRVAAEVVTAAWSALDEQTKRHAVAVAERAS